MNIYDANAVNLEQSLSMCYPLLILSLSHFGRLNQCSISHVHVYSVGVKCVCVCCHSIMQRVVSLVCVCVCVYFVSALIRAVSKFFLIYFRMTDSSCTVDVREILINQSHRAEIKIQRQTGTLIRLNSWIEYCVASKTSIIRLLFFFCFIR